MQYAAWLKINTFILLHLSRFDDNANKETNKLLMENIMAVNKNEDITPCTVKCKSNTVCQILFCDFALQVLYVFILNLRKVRMLAESPENKKRITKASTAS